MSRGLDAVKVREWRDRLARFARSGWTVARFCHSESVSVPSFYAWRKKLAQADGRWGLERWPLGRSGSREERSPKSKRDSSPKRASSPQGRWGLFRRVAVTAAEGSAAEGVVIRLPGGVEIALGHDRDSIEQVVAQLLDHQQHLNGTHPDRVRGGRSC
jgi:hypothetical protein